VRAKQVEPSWVTLCLETPLAGVLFGASLQLAGAVSSRLVILLAGVVVFMWLCIGLLRLIHRSAWPVFSRQRDRLVVWARAKPAMASSVILSLLDPTRPESLGLFIASLLLLGGGLVVPWPPGGRCFERLAGARALETSTT
jgi:hypothetical protein